MELNCSMAINLVIKLMADVEKMDKPGADKKKWVIFTRNIIYLLVN